MATDPTDQVGTHLMFENERVRVWDLALAPGASLAKHIHRTDYFFIVESGSLVRLYNLVSVYYHALKAAAQQYIQDAQQAGDQQFVQFFQQSQQNARQAAEQAKTTLQQQLATGTS